MSPGHLVAACCFLVLAGMRAAEGSWVWAGVFAAAALAQGLLGSRFRPAHREPTDRPRQASTWRLLTASSCALTAALLVVQPALGLVSGVVALYCVRATRLRGSSG